MPRIPTRVLTSAPQGSTNPAASTPRVVAPPNVRSLAPALPREQFPDRAQNRQQSAANQAFRQAAARFDADHQLVPGITFAAGVSQDIVHRLGRAYQGAQVINVRPAVSGATPAALYYITPPTDARLLAVQVTLTCLVSLIGDVVIW